MIEGLKPYAEYKNSGSKWLGAVPAKWEVRNLRTLISKRTERDRPDLPLLSVAREKGVFVRSMTDADENHNVIPEDLTNYKVALAGNLVINKMKAWQGSMGIAPCDGIVSPAYFVFDFRIANHAFGQRLLRSKPYVAHFGQASDGVRVGQWDLSVPGMRQIPVLVPTEDEQAAIVRFLDHANRKIDGFIRAKRKLIGLLNEQKQAIIHRAVTGTDEVRMVKDKNGNSSFILQPSTLPKKPSGIPWLGEIPVGWEMIPIKRIAKVLNGFAFSSEIYTDSGIPLIRIGDVKSEGSVDIEYAAKLPADYLGSHSFVEVKKGDLLMAMTGATIGKVAKYTHDSPSLLNQRVCAFRCRDGRATQEYLFLVLSSRSYLQQVLLACYGGAQPNISDSTLAGFKMPIAPFDLQVEIVASVAQETGPLTTAITRTEREIALMQEYRTRLTADVVTGKLDVREAAARLPEPESDHPYPNEVDLTSDLREDAEADHSADGED